MGLIIQEIIKKISSSFEKELENLIKERRDISEFILATKKTLDEIGVTLVAEALETIDQVYKNSKDRKRFWTVKEKAAEKTLTTIFGEVRYERTYYQNKKTGEYSYLSDEAVGISAHDKLDASLKAKLIEEAGALLYEMYTKQKAAVLVFEGTDAAGKGGSIRRLVRDMDPRGYDIATTAAPDATERQYHYLWRFMRDMPQDGMLTIFDRSWYGRVLVERIEQFTPTHRWQEAFEEINAFEHHLVDQGRLVLKFLLIIDKDEQKKRFDAREADPDKEHKLTDEDWRNREKFDLYEEAMDEMVTCTSTKEAPWIVIPATDKRYARIEVLKQFIEHANQWLRGN